MTDLELAVAVADTINERMTHEDSPALVVSTVGGYTSISCGDVCVWDHENHVIRCDVCDRESYEDHTCPGETVEGVVEYVEAQLKGIAKGVLELAGGVPLPYSSLCVECGPDVRIDEDGCCIHCGNGAVGAWLRKWIPTAAAEATP